MLQATYFNLLISQVNSRVIQPRTKCHHNPFTVLKRISSTAVSGIEPLALKVDPLASELSLIKGLLFNSQSCSLFDATETMSSVTIPKSWQEH